MDKKESVMEEKEIAIIDIDGIEVIENNKEASSRIQSELTHLIAMPTKEALEMVGAKMMKKEGKES